MFEHEIPHMDERSADLSPAIPHHPAFIHNLGRHRATQNEDEDETSLSQTKKKYALKIQRITQSNKSQQISKLQNNKFQMADSPKRKYLKQLEASDETDASTRSASAQ